MKLIVIILAIFLTACGSTPYEDDYAKHVNLISDSYHNDNEFKFNFASPQVDLRGAYIQDNTVGSSNILYAGGAGVVGMLAQIGTHSALINSERNKKLAFQQKEANKHISPLIGLSNELTLNDLIGDYSPKLDVNTQQSNDTFEIRPIFFSNKEMTKISLKSVIWLPLSDTDKKKKKSKKQPKVRYQNMIQVYGFEFNEEEQKQLLEPNKLLLTKTLSSLLQTALNIAENEITGKYNNNSHKVETFIINDNNKNKVVRGKLITQQCGYRIIQDIHSWFIATPSETPLSATEEKECSYI